MNKISALLLASLLVSQGCARQDESRPSVETKEALLGGKLLVRSMREGNHANFTGLYYQDSENLKRIVVDPGHPTWSSDGKSFSVTGGDENKIFTYDGDLNRMGEYELPAYPISHTWTDSDTKILTVIRKSHPDGEASKEGDFELRLMEIDLRSSEIKTLHTYELNHYADELVVSQDGRFVATSPAPSYQNKHGWIEIYDRNTDTTKKYKFSGTVLGWYPDGRHLMVDANYYADGKRINDRLGAVVKYDLVTGAYEIIYEPDVFMLRAKAYAGCKYVGYIAGTKTGGTACFIRDVATGQIYQITQPVMNPDLNQMSQDMDFDWFPRKK